MSTSTHVITTGLAWLQTPYPILQYTLGGFVHLPHREAD